MLRELHVSTILLLHSVFRQRTSLPDNNHFKPLPQGLHGYKAHFSEDCRHSLPGSFHTWTCPAGHETMIFSLGFVPFNCEFCPLMHIESQPFPLEQCRTSFARFASGFCWFMDSTQGTWILWNLDCIWTWQQQGHIRPHGYHKLVDADWINTLPTLDGRSGNQGSIQASRP